MIQCINVSYHNDLKISVYLFFHFNAFNIFPQKRQPHQWLSGSVLKIGRQELPGSILACACRSNRSEFSLVFSETRINMSQSSLERSPGRASNPSGSGPLRKQLALIPRPFKQPNLKNYFHDILKLTWHKILLFNKKLVYRIMVM